MDEVRRCTGTQFDPTVAEAFIKIIRQNGPAFVINSARSITHQYAATLLANEGLYQNMFASVAPLGTAIIGSRRGGIMPR